MSVAMGEPVVAAIKMQSQFENIICGRSSYGIFRLLLKGNHMRLFQGIMVLFLLAMHVDLVYSDGLVYNLPKDGTWVIYQLDGDSKNTGEFGITGNMTGKLRIASVGLSTHSNEPCRWIEIQFDFTLKTGNEQFRKMDLCKVLIPEKYLSKGQSPLDHVVQAWYRSNEDDSFQKMDNPNDSRTVLPIILAKPLQDCERLEMKKVNSKLGELTCEGVRGSLRIQKYCRGVLPEVYEKCVIENRLHPASPFGVVTSQWTINSGNGSQVWRLTLVDIGKDATRKMKEK